MFRQGFRAIRESREGEERRGIFRMMVGPELAEWLHRAAEVFAVDSGRREQDWLMIRAQQFLQYLVRGQVMNPVEADVEAFLVACEQKRLLRFVIRRRGRRACF